VFFSAPSGATSAASVLLSVDAGATAESNVNRAGSDEEPSSTRRRLGAGVDIRALSVSGVSDVEREAARLLNGFGQNHSKYIRH
jgi:hypothetical protein